VTDLFTYFRHFTYFQLFRWNCVCSPIFFQVILWQILGSLGP
jgi:hypothetical protein